MLAQRAGEGATMRKTDESRELTLQKTFNGLTALTQRFAEVDTLMGQVFKQLTGSGAGGALCELSLAEVHFLAAVGEFAPINGAMLTRKLGLTKGGVSKIANRLLGKGMVESEKIEGNRKAQYFALTEAGKRACRVHAALHEAAREKIIDSLSSYRDAEISLFNSILHDISSAVEKSSSDIRNNFRKHLDKRGVHPG